MFIRLEGGHVFAPEDLGVCSLLIGAGKMLRVGPVDLECEVIDATGLSIVPGLVDPHEHLIGAGGEQGFGSRQPEVTAAELLSTGVTTAVGCLGTDVVTRGM